jgi:hypothetical protein
MIQPRYVSQHTTITIHTSQYKWRRGEWPLPYISLTRKRETTYKQIR